MYDYKGLKYPSSLYDWEISPSELKLYMHLVTDVPMDEIFWRSRWSPTTSETPLAS